MDVRTLNGKPPSSTTNTPSKAGGVVSGVDGLFGAQAPQNSFAASMAELKNGNPELGESKNPEPSKAEKKAKSRADKAARKAARHLKGDFDLYPHLMALKPVEKYMFRSDYFTVDNQVACVLGFFHDDAARDDFGPFWGISRIPGELGKGVTVVVLEQVRKMGQKWIDDRVKVVEKLDKLEEGEQAQSGTMSSRRKAAKVADDMEIISGEIQDGASYLHIHNRLFIKAPNLETLDNSIEAIRRLYIERFATLTVAAYPAEQRQEQSKLFAKNEKKRGKGFHFTSLEFAGSHSLVTNGLNDPAGEYVGFMIGDVNTSAVVFDVNKYNHHVVLADATVEEVMDRAFYSDMWGSKLSQAAMIDNGKVVHLVLNGAKLDTLGPEFNQLTSRVDLSNGDVNMFEMFGNQEDELSIFAAHMQKLVLMVEQAYESTENDRSIIRGELEKIATQFYVDQKMWAFNAKENRDKLRVVDIPHTDVPRLQLFVAYLNMKYKAQSSGGGPQHERLTDAYKLLETVFENLLNSNGDLFNTYTNDAIDGVRESSRVIYDFSKLMRRGKGVAMAQLVNIVSFAVGNLGRNDTLVIHGAEKIDEGVKKYIEDQLDHLFHRGGRVAYLYNDVDKMLADAKFNRFDAADYTILGPMRDATVIEYQRQLAQEIPKDMANLVTRRGQTLSYLRRGVTNVVFETDLSLGTNPERAEERKALLGLGAGTRPKSQAVIDASTKEREARVAATGAGSRVVPGKQPRPRGARKVLGAGPREQ